MGNHIFMGYERPNGRFGVRNHLAVISGVGCINEATRRIAMEVGGVPVLHSEGCGQLPMDQKMAGRILAGIGANPNVGAVLVVGMGCEALIPDSWMPVVAAAGKPVELVVFRDEGGHSRLVEKGVEIGRKLKAQLDTQRRVEADAAKLVLGVKCGASDATSGMASNPVAGMTADLLVAEGGSFIFCETTELIGAEHLMASRAEKPEVGERLLHVVDRLEREVASFGEDMRGSQPSTGNMAGGITTIEEKSLGAICKSGTTPLQGVLEYGEEPRGKGLYFMDSPGRDMQAVSGLAASGINIMLFSTGRCTPQGFPVVPVMKLSANATTNAWLREHIDVDLSGVMDRSQTMAQAADATFRHVLSVASGTLTRAEELGYTESMDIWTHGPSI